MTKVIWDIFWAIAGLYIDVFTKYKLAGAILTVICVAVYVIWRKANEKAGTEPDEWWQKPGFVLSAIWLVLTPILGFVLSALGLAHASVALIWRLYIDVFKANPAAGATVTVLCGAAYWVCRVWIIKRGCRPEGIHRQPEVILVALWFVATPLVGLALHLKASPSKDSPASITINVDDSEGSTISVDVHQGEGDIKSNAKIQQDEQKNE